MTFKRAFIIFGFTYLQAKDKATRMKKILFVLSAAIMAMTVGNFANSQTYTATADPQKIAAGTTMAKAFHDSAHVYAAAGLYHEAAAFECKALDCYERIGMYNSDYASIMNDLALYLYFTGNLTEAFEIGEQATIMLGETAKENPVDYLMSLSNMIIYNYALGNFHDVINIGENSLDAIKAVLGENDESYANLLTFISQSYFITGDIGKASSASAEAVGIFRTNGVTNTDNYASALIIHAQCDINNGNYDNARILANEVVKIQKDLNNLDGTCYALALNVLSQCSSLDGGYDEAILLTKEAIGVIENADSDNTAIYATLLLNLSGYELLSGNYKDAAELSKKSLDLIEQTSGTDNLSYAIALKNLALSYNSTGNYKDAAKLAEQAADIFENHNYIKNPNYVESLNTIALNYCVQGDYKSSADIASKALDILQETGLTANLNYPLSLNITALCHYALGDYNSAISLGAEALKISEKYYGEDNVNNALSYSVLSQGYLSAGDYVKAIEYANKVIGLLGTDHVFSAIALNVIAQYNYVTGEYGKALSIGSEALLLAEKYYGKDNPNNTPYINNMSIYNAAMGNYSEAIKFGHEALELTKESIGYNNIQYALCCNNLALCYLYTGNVQNAIKFGAEALDVSKKHMAANGTVQSLFLNNLSQYNQCMGEYAEAQRQAEEALKVFKNEGYYDNAFVDYGMLLSNLAMCNYLNDNYNEALEYGLKALEHVSKKGAGFNQIYNVTALQLMAMIYCPFDDVDNIVRYTTEATDKTNRLILSNFKYLTGYERGNFWHRYNYWYENFLPNIAYKIRDKKLMSTLYDGMLLSKGILLNSEIEMSRLLLESGDTTVVSLYEQMRANRNIVSKQREDIAMKSTSMNDSIKTFAMQYADSLERVADMQERELVERSKVYGDYTRNLAIDWQDVKRHLNAGDIAIEFLEVPVTNDSIVYAALTLRQDYDFPHFIKLFGKHELSDLNESLYFSSPILYNMIWQPLSSELEGVENVYFSSAGELHRIAIEYAPQNESTMFNELYNAYRLSSTRQLAVAHDVINEPINASLYGGLRYDATPTAIAIDDNNNIIDNSRYADFILQPTPDSLISKNVYIPDLPGTKKEVEEVYSLMNDMGMEADIFTDTLGTEASFKALSGKRRNTILIATHGFYGKNEPDNNTMPPMMILDNNRYVEDKAMTRSGLLFAGAANAWQIPDMANNGILTAQEVAGLDLRGLDMCVLSACETGMGKITGEGVYGLQRGFKKAGAKTLLVSLRKVYDDATRILMTEFYRNYLSGKSKIESIKAAQQFLRNYIDPDTDIKSSGGDAITPYAEPVFWAYFILVDAL